MFFNRSGNAITVVIPLVPHPSDGLSGYHLIEELQEVPLLLDALPALKMLRDELEKVSGESLPPTLVS